MSKEEVFKRPEPPRDSGCLTSVFLGIGGLFLFFGFITLFAKINTERPYRSSILTKNFDLYDIYSQVEFIAPLIVILIGVLFLGIAVLDRINFKLKKLVWSQDYDREERAWLAAQAQAERDKRAREKQAKFSTSAAEDGTLADTETEARLRQAKEILDNRDPNVQALKAQEHTKRP